LSRLRLLALLLLGACASLPASAPSGPDSGRLRLIIETDLGGDPDDEQSMVRFLLYANEWDVEGIIANRPRAREKENLNVERTGLGIARAFIAAYAEAWPNLARHDPRYPAPERLRERTVAGYDDVEAGVDLLIAAVDRPDPRPVWFSNWGTDRGSAVSCLQRALDRVLRERGPEGYARFKGRLRLSSSDKFGEHTATIAPPFPLWVDTFRPEIDRKRWYHRFSALTAKAGGFDVERHVRSGHGRLGALYPLNTTHPQKEGDSMAFLYLVPTGMNDPEQPTWGSWGGRYGPRDDVGGKPYYWANQADAWNGTTERDHVVARWAAALQNDFRARMDWCVGTGNRPPVARLRGAERLRVRAGAAVRLDASPSSDPDGDRLSYDWIHYREPGGNRTEVSFDRRGPHATFQAPAVKSPEALHLILAVTDSGTPPLTRYRRVIATVEP
jgi:hypothetical protein